MSIRFYNTINRKKVKFEPITPGKVKLYTCGPTVYDTAHIGNFRTFLFEDLLKRFLIFKGYDVYHVMNITDVDDKTIKRANTEGMMINELTLRYTKEFMNDIKSLKILPADKYPRATDHIAEQIDFVKELEAKGFTYKLTDGIYFDSKKLENYGHLARLDIGGLQEGARVEKGERRFLTDFALWKFSPEGETRQMEWESPWGKGFPGWHIECSAMSAKFLGDYFDIHCGGEDHIPVHHTNEIAQTEAARGTRLANFWMHGYFLRLKDDKMSKSSGSFITLQTILDYGFEPLVYRYFLLGSHYRTQITFSWEGLEAAKKKIT